jgi:hypothetical protein
MTFHVLVFTEVSLDLFFFFFPKFQGKVFVVVVAVVVLLFPSFGGR